MSPELEPRLDPFPRIPEDLKEYDQWLLWTYEDDRKVPKNPHTQGNAAVNQPSTWTTYEDAVYEGQRRNLGLGFVLTEDDPFTCIDFDKCIRGKEINPQVLEMVQFLGGYVELSPSMTGLHVWIRSELLVSRKTEGVEVYSYGRYLTMTGRANPRALNFIPDRTGELEAFMQMYFPPERKQAKPEQFRSTERPLEDEAIWQILFHSKNEHFFKALYNGDLSVVHGEDHSRAVLMLANTLAALTGGDHAKMKRMLYQTGLVNDKWQEPRRGFGTWLDMQIEDAINYVRLKGKWRG